MNVGGRHMLGGQSAPGSKKDIAAQEAFHGISEVLLSVRPTSVAIAEKIDTYINTVREGSGKSFGRPMSPENKVKIESFLKDMLAENLGGNKATFPKMKLFQAALESLSEKNSKYADFGLTEIDCLVPPQNKLFLESHEILSHLKSLASAVIAADTRASTILNESRQREVQHVEAWYTGVESSTRYRTDVEVLGTQVKKFLGASEEFKTPEGDQRRNLGVGVARFTLELRHEKEADIRSNSTRGAMSSYHDYTTYREINRGRMEAIVQDPAYRLMSREMQGHLFRLNAELDVLNNQL